MGAYFRAIYDLICQHHQNSHAHKFSLWHEIKQCTKPALFNQELTHFMESINEFEKEKCKHFDFGF